MCACVRVSECVRMWVCGCGTVCVCVCVRVRGCASYVWVRVCSVHPRAFVCTRVHMSPSVCLLYDHVLEATSCSAGEDEPALREPINTSLPTPAASLAYRQSRLETDFKHLAYPASSSSLINPPILPRLQVFAGVALIRLGSSGNTRKSMYRGCSSVGRASNRHAADAGSIPMCGKGFLSQTQLPVHTLLRCPYTLVCNRAH